MNVAADTKVLMGQQDQALPLAADPAIRQPVEDDVSFSAARQQFAPVAVTQVIRSRAVSLRQPAWTICKGLNR
jgi:hypothetical protein